MGFLDSFSSLCSVAMFAQLLAAPNYQHQLSMFARFIQKD